MGAPRVERKASSLNVQADKFDKNKMCEPFQTMLLKREKPSTRDQNVKEFSSSRIKGAGFSLSENEFSTLDVYRWRAGRQRCKCNCAF